MSSTKHKIVLVISTRPDVIRLARFIKLAKQHPDIELVTISTGQHYDHNLFGTFYEQFKLPQPDIQLNSAAPTDCQQHAKLIEQLEQPLKEINPACCIFLGDVNGVVGAIVPYKLGIPVIHIEAGYRSFNMDMPEERNRILVDRISSRLYCYHENYRLNLVREGISPFKSVNVGNIIVDALNSYKEEIDAVTHETLSKFKLESRKYILMTLHRNENLKRTDILESRISEAAAIQQKLNMPLLLPLMPRVRAAVESKQVNLPSSFITCEPQAFFEFVALEKNAKLIITDSGTVQEEAAIFGIPCLVQREQTERPETFQTGCVSFMKDNFTDIFEHEGKCVNLGDGFTSQRIIDDLVMTLNKNMLGHTDYIDRYVGWHYA